MRLKFQIIHLILSLLTALQIDVVNSIKCYECSVTKSVRYNNEVVEKLCVNFNSSTEDQFEVDCPYSTMCEKKIFRLHLINRVQVTYERGCAKQKRTSMVYENRKWVDKVNIEENIYSEGCFNSSDDDTEYCYCKGKFCNSSSRSSLNIIPCLILLLMLMYVK